MGLDWAAHKEALLVTGEEWQLCFGRWKYRDLCARTEPSDPGKADLAHKWASFRKRQPKSKCLLKFRQKEKPGNQNDH